MAGSILNRMIFWELVKVFLLSLVGLTGLFLMAGLIQQAAQLGLGLMQVLKAIPLFVPSTLPYTIPATTLFASCVVYGRLSHDNEVVAIKGAGVHLFQVLKPALLLGVLTTALTAGLYHSVIPVTQQMLQQQILEDPEEVLYNQLRRERCVRNANFPYVIYVRDVQGRRLVDVVLKRRVKLSEQKAPSAQGQTYLGYDLVARAREARLRVDMDSRQLFLDPDRFVFYDKNSQGVTHSTSPIAVELPEHLSGKDIKARPLTLTWDEIGPRLEELRGRLKDIEERWAKSRQLAADERDPIQLRLFAAQDQNFRAQAEDTGRQIRNTAAEYWMRPSLAVGCLVFALIGCPVGIWANRADYLSTFVICFLPTVFVYYPLLLFGSNTGKEGKLPLGFGCFLANLVVGVIGLVLTARLLRR
jgi:lipopolysaccharide export system permease protein